MYPYTERFPSKLNSINSVGDTSPYFGAPRFSGETEDKYFSTGSYVVKCGIFL